jgi:hypothetical protein
MAVLGDDLEAVEVGAHLAHVVDHRGNPKNGGMTAIVLKSRHSDILTGSRTSIILKGGSSQPVHIEKNMCTLVNLVMCKS